MDGMHACNWRNDPKQWPMKKILEVQCVAVVDLLAVRRASFSFECALPQTRPALCVDDARWARSNLFPPRRTFRCLVPCKPFQFLSNIPLPDDPKLTLS